MNVKLNLLNILRKAKQDVTAFGNMSSSTEGRYKLYIIKNFKFFSFASKKLKGQLTGWEMLLSVKVQKMGNLLEAGYYTHVSNLST